MKYLRRSASSTANVGFAFACILFAATSVMAADSDRTACSTAGPQAPRDIRNPFGVNKARFAFAPSAEKMNLCDIHFHRYAEHRAGGYSRLAGDGDHKGYICNGSTPPERTTHGGNKASGCNGIAVGDTIEVHWVFTTCEVEPGPTLDSCFTDTCKDPQLRVEARVFQLTDRDTDPDFRTFADYSSGNVKLPSAIEPVQYLGSTTGPSYNDGTCSPFKVTWNVASQCQNLNINTIDNWCGKAKNAFEEDHAHGVRSLVTDAALLSQFK
jgi:hypothetical protein